MKRRRFPTVRMAVYDLESPHGEIIDWSSHSITLDPRGQAYVRSFIQHFNEASANDPGECCLACAAFPYDDTKSLEDQVVAVAAVEVEAEGGDGAP